LLAGDSFTRVSSAGWGTADAGGTWTHRFTSGADGTGAAGVDGARGNLTISTGSSLLILASYVGGATIGDYDVVATVRADSTSGAYLMVLGRVVDQNRFYAAQMNMDGNTVTIRKNVNGFWTTLGAGSAPSPALAANTDYRIRFQLQGSTLRARWWLAGEAEPADWAVQVNDTTYAAGQVGVAAALTASRSTASYSFDDFAASSPQ